jgi:WD40 repeat protein
MESTSTRSCSWKGRFHNWLGYQITKVFMSFSIISNKNQLLIYYMFSQTFNINGAHSVMVRALDFNPNKPNQIASAGDDCKVRFWDTRNTTECIKEISDHTHWYFLM